MSSFVVEGGHKLSGTIRPQGAKNEALEVISAVLLTSSEVTISNVPEILDIRNLILLLEGMGVKVKRMEKGKYSFKADDIDQDYVNSEDFVRKCASFRGSLMVVGPLLARFGHTWFPKPGGDKIGRRRVDTHITGMLNLGAELRYDQDRKAFYLYVPEGKHLTGKYMLLDEASVTGTANILMAATLAEGETTIYNAACEPYIQQLSRMLVRMGAKIDGIGSNLLKVTGVITIKDVSYSDLGMIPDAFRRLGITVEQRGDDIFIPEQESYVIESFMDGSIMNISDAPWPGLTPDLLSVMLVVATQCRGSVLIHQKMFESRLFFVDRLIDHNFRLRANNMLSPDIRAGIAMLIAAMSAKGTSVIGNIEQIDRGYEDIDLRLNALGASITRQS